MLEINQLSAGGTPNASLTLPFDLRQKSRLRTRLDDGTEAGLFLPRGTILRHGDCLLADDGRIVEIHAATEKISTITADTAQQLARAAYHLGNRHVALQIGSDRLHYLHDHVLDKMVRQLGLNVRTERAPFEPEAGAYGEGH